jgi:excisionase family DNA binding protein
MADTALLTVEEAARKLNCSPAKVRALIVFGKLPAIDLRVDDRSRHYWRVHAEALDRMSKKAVEMS